jgi:hypothetical protein
MTPRVDHTNWVNKGTMCVDITPKLPRLPTSPKGHSLEPIEAHRAQDNDTNKKQKIKLAKYHIKLSTKGPPSSYFNQISGLEKHTSSNPSCIA